MELRVAKAICIADGVDPDQVCYGTGRIMPEGWSGPAWRVRIGQARAAIRAMRDPTREIGDCFAHFRNDKALWQGCIDAASPPTS